MYNNEAAIRLVLRGKNFWDALEQLDAMILVNPLDPALPFAKGSAHLSYEGRIKYEEAAECFKQAGDLCREYEQGEDHEKEGPKDPTKFKLLLAKSLLNTGFCLKNADQDDDAIRALEASEVICKDNMNTIRDLQKVLAVALEVRGSILLGQGEYEKAIKVCTEAIGYPHKTASMYQVRGAAYHKLEKYIDALADYSNVATLSKNPAAIHCEKGNIYIAQKQYAKAIASFDEALKYKPKDVEILLKKGKALQMLGQHQDALSAYSDALVKDPSCFEAYLGTGEVFKVQGQYAAAAAFFGKALSIKTDDENALRAKAECEEELIKALAGSSSIQDPLDPLLLGEEGSGSESE